MLTAKNYKNSALRISWVFYLLLVGLPSLVWSGEFDAFGPQNFLRETGSPEPFSYDFSVNDPNTDFYLSVYNGGLEDAQEEKISSSIISINGTQVIGPEKFNQKIDFFQIPITLGMDNTIGVELRGKPGGIIAVRIFGIDSESPTIKIVEPADGSVANDTTPQIVVTYSDNMSGIDPDTFYAEINGQDSTSLFVVTGSQATYQPTTDLPAGENTVTASIKDRAANSATDTSTFSTATLRAIPGAYPTSGVAPLTVYFSANGEDPDGTIEAFRWDFEGNGSWDKYATVATDYTYTYYSPGTYEAALQVKSSTGLMDTVSITITVENNPPVATADVIPSNGAIPLAVQFTGSGADQDGSIVLYEWDFDGDGTYDWSSTTSGNTSHTYTELGVYNAVFRVTDNSGDTGTAMAVTTAVNAGSQGSPTASGSASPDTGDAPLAVSFSGTGTDPDGTIVLYEWDFDNDGTYDWSSPSSASASYIYAMPGTYVAVFRITDDSGLTGEDYIPIFVGLQVELSIVETDCTFDPTQGESTGIGSYLSAPVSAFVEIKKQSGLTVRTIPITEPPANDPPVLNDNMESGANGWTHGGSNDLWQLGTPSYGTSSAHSGTNCWATRLNGSYYNSMNSWLLSPQVTLDASNPKMLSFWHYFNSESYYDGGIVEITTDGTSFTRIYPESGYPYSGFRFGGDAYSGSLGGWSLEKFSLASYLGQTVQIRFRFLTDSSVTYPGWYIDDIKIDESSLASVLWDGKDESNLVVTDGLYYAILHYQFEGSWHELDLTHTTGGTRHSFPYGSGSCDVRASFANGITFYPFEDDFMEFPFTLCKAQEVTLFMGPLWGGGSEARLRTIINRKVFPAGQTVALWDGLTDQGDIAQLSGDNIITGAWRYDLPENAIYVTGGSPEITNVSAESNYFSPFSEKCDEYGIDEGVTVTYTVSEDVDFVELRVYNVHTSSLNRTFREYGVEAGENTIFWDGKNNNNEYVGIGDYRVGVVAVDAEGNESMLRYSLVRLDY